MKADELAAAMEKNAYTLDDGTPCRCERCAHHREAARLLRALDAVRIAADALPVEHTHAPNCCPRCRLTDALRGAGGGA